MSGMEAGTVRLRTSGVAAALVVVVLMASSAAAQTTAIVAVSRAQRTLGQSTVVSGELVWNPRGRFAVGDRAGRDHGFVSWWRTDDVVGDTIVVGATHAPARSDVRRVASRRVLRVGDGKR